MDTIKPQTALRTAELLNPPSALFFRLEPDDTIPNNRLPLLVYEQAFKLLSEDPAAVFEHVFATNGWADSWRDGIYNYHHYHSTAHEALGVFSGSARVQFGGERGIVQELQVGDVVVIPAGVAHKCLESSSDFGVVGAYPAGQKWDMNYGKAGERPRADSNIARVPLPELDPAYGTDGPLQRYWMA